ncbi:hypothetical protein F5Y16DRAFT_372108 [Xylariaceae sp. FL0255]|nr:hypothetical protein F5Y16DRAFT_372108 [Xylariaceae sp. FL0255]
MDLSKSAQTYLIDQVKKKPNRTYLWAELVLSMVHQTGVHTKQDIQRTLSVLPESVYDAYEKILSRSTNPEKMETILQIIVAAERPFKLVEMEMVLALALAEDPDTAPFRPGRGRTGGDRRRFANSLRDVCGLFIHIREEKIYLLHQIAREFLLMRRKDQVPPAGTLKIRPRSASRSRFTNTSRFRPAQAVSTLHQRAADRQQWQHSLDFRDRHNVMVQACVDYLSLLNTKAGRILSKAPPQMEFLDRKDRQEIRKACEDYVLLPYAALHWLTHFNAISEAAQDEILNEVMFIIDPNENNNYLWFAVY